MIEVGKVLFVFWVLICNLTKYSGYYMGAMSGTAYYTV